LRHLSRIVSNYSAAPPSDPGRARRVAIEIPRECAGLRLDLALARALPAYSRSRIRQWLDRGCVGVDGGDAAPTRRVEGGERVVIDVPPAPEETAFRPEDIPLEIVHEDDALLVVDKPAGLVVHPGSGNWQGTLLNALLRHAPSLAHLPRAGIVHRLDKDTSGLLVVAKTLEAQTALVRQLQARTVTREYLALASGAIARGGRVEAPVGRHPVRRTEMAVVESGKPAITHYEVVERFGAACTLLRCRLETGRTHQIRVHLASIGHPLVGDPVYGRGRRTCAAVTHPRQALHAARLALVHPATGEAVSWTSPLPADFAALLERLRGEPEGRGR
jgi:23S rRNA pseudouridine1911/1915/1917 synthase